MADNILSPDELIAGADMVYDLEVPGPLLHPVDGKRTESATTDQQRAPNMVVRLRPLTIGAFQLIMKASRQDPALIPLLMIKEALVQPSLSLDNVRRLHLGLVNFLIEHIRAISGLAEKKSPEPN